MLSESRWESDSGTFDNTAYRITVRARVLDDLSHSSFRIGSYHGKFASLREQIENALVGKREIKRSVLLTAH